MFEKFFLMFVHSSLYLKAIHFYIFVKFQIGPCNKVLINGNLEKSPFLLKSLKLSRLFISLTPAVPIRAQPISIQTQRWHPESVLPTPYVGARARAYCDTTITWSLKEHKEFSLRDAPDQSPLQGLRTKLTFKNQSHILNACSCGKFWISGLSL